MLKGFERWRSTAAYHARRIIMRGIAWAMLAAVVALPVFGQNAPNGMNFYSLDREAQPGRETAVRLSRMLPMVSGAKLDAYIATLATSLQRDGDTRFSYSFAVYEDRKPAVVDRVPLVQP